ncbi:MAG: hypothetical protein R3A44_36540 [Caldilineaceae bacterium]
MSAYQIRKSIAFSRRPDVKRNLAWWGITVYNWCRKHRSLRSPLDMTSGKKVPAAFSAMAAGLANHIFSVREILLSPVYLE